jgi:uncharacterized protein (DUF2235 family)
MPSRRRVPQPSSPGGKTIVIFADGTGSAYSLQESNIWRLYHALERGDGPDGRVQVARYIPGVGTSANAALRLIDGATGFGVPANVRKLYRFLCWNWEPGDEIHLFGFSRGAFTVRALAGMIGMQGLMPRRIGDRPVGTAEMRRNAMGAWRAYRHETAPLIKDGRLQMNPLISVVRGLVGALVTAKRRALGQMLHREVVAHRHPGHGRREVPIRFMGVYDTVEAYGIPVKEVAEAVNWLVWPFQFRNQWCSPVVQTVRHGLALDDERLTFHPIRFDRRPHPEGLTVKDIAEVWFAGMHSDVGGGYPDAAVALDPLIWMQEEAAAAGLRFRRPVIDALALGRHPQALIHDSRAGLASLWRYAPRRTDEPLAAGLPPVLHGSALAKMLRGLNGYMPLVLPARFQVLGETASAPLVRDEAKQAAVGRLVWQRRATNLAMLGLGVAGLALLYAALFAACRAATGWGPVPCAAAAPLALWADWGFGWSGFLTRQALPLGGLAVLALALHGLNGSLEDRIRDASRGLWRPAP